MEVNYKINNKINRLFNSWILVNYAEQIRSSEDLTRLSEDATIVEEFKAQVAKALE